jgi:Na+/H+ antiporter NhaD/arsenite permease-like protein
LEVTGIIEELGEAVGVLVGDDIVLATVFMVWIPGLLSAVIDNIPVSAVLAPLALQFASVSPVLPLALVFAVNIGGFILPIGSPANILALALAENEHDPISLADFAKIATPLGLFMLVIGTGWFLLVSMFI